MILKKFIDFLKNLSYYDYRRDAYKSKSRRGDLLSLLGDNKLP